MPSSSTTIFEGGADSSASLSTVHDGGSMARRVRAARSDWAEGLRWSWGRSRTGIRELVVQCVSSGE